MQPPITAPSDLTHQPSERTTLPIFIMAVAAFIIVTTEFLILGLLPALAKDLNISIAAAGQVVTLFAFTVMLFGPSLTAKLARLDRKKLFVTLLMVFVASNALAAISPNIWILAIARFIAALALPVFWGTSSETAALLAGPANAGKAVSKVFMGISAAFVFGIPLGTLASDRLGWRGSFWLLSLLALVIAYTALFPICQVRVMLAGEKAQALAATMNISAANAGIGLGAIGGGLGIQHFGLPSLTMIAAAIAVAAILWAGLMRYRKGAIKFGR